MTVLPDLSKHFVSFWRDLGYRPSKTRAPRGIYFKKFHLSTKMGPNGHALYTSMVDLKLIIEHSTLLMSLRLIGGLKFRKSFDLLLHSINHLPKSLFPVEGTTLRRLSYFPDLETKVRVVAILDYWSQTALRPLHDYLFRVLRKIPQDSTFHQGKFREAVKDWKVFYSYDLTAATDRFPIHIISGLLGGLLPKWYVDSWSYTMIGLPFEYRRGKTREKVFYSVGNPMGAYSSWNSFTLTHHYIMYWICKENGWDWKNSKYLILGDDVLIGCPLLGEEYKKLIHLLGVEISDIKSHVSSELFEFAKRLVYKGVEITPFPISSVKETQKRFYLLVNLLIEETRKGWEWIEGIPFTIKSFYQIVRKFNSKYRTELSERSFVCELMMKIMRGTIPANDGLNTIIRRNGFPLPELNPDQGLSILSGTALECFIDNSPLDYSAGEPLGEYALMRTIEISGIDRSSLGDAVDSIPSSVPILSVFGQIEEQYLEIGRQAYLIDTIGKGEWPMHLRSLALPMTDRIFVERASHTISRVSAILGDRVIKNLKGLRASDF